MISRGENFWGTSVYRFLGDDSGATAIEYGLIVGLIFVVIIVSVSGMATESTSMYNTVQTELQSVNNP